MMFNTIINELTHRDFQGQQQDIVQLFPSFWDRVDVVSKGGPGNGSLTHMGLNPNDNTIWEFIVPSGTTKNKSYVVRVKFNDLGGSIKKALKDPSMWLADRSRPNMNNLAREVLFNTDLSLSSDSPGDKWWGHNTIRTDRDVELDYHNSHQPNIRNPGKHGIMGKHAALVMKVLPAYISTMARYLKEEYADLVDAAVKVANAEEFNPEDKEAVPHETEEKPSGIRVPPRIQALNDPRLKALRRTSESRLLETKEAKVLIEQMLNEAPWFDLGDAGVVDLQIERKPSKEKVMTQIRYILSRSSNRREVVSLLMNALLQLNQVGITKDDVLGLLSKQI
jgi:hypothetical protein